MKHAFLILTLVSILGAPLAHAGGPPPWVRGGPPAGAGPMGRPGMPGPGAPRGPVARPMPGRPGGPGGPGMGRPPAHSPYQPGQGAAPIDIQVEVTRMQGLGCPPGGATATVSPDGSSVSVLFDKMSTELSAGAPSADKKVCMIYLGLKFSGQYRVAIVGSDARGFVSVPAGGTSTITVQHYSIFSMNPAVLKRMNLTQTFIGPRSEDITLHSDFSDIPMWSYCGSQMQGRQSMPLMTIALTIDSSNSSPSENLIAAIDSLDIGGGSSLTYQLLWTQDTRNCPQ